MSADLPPLTFAFFVMPGFPMACLTSAIEPLRAANEISGVNAFNWLVVAENEKSVHSSANVKFEADRLITDLADCDAIYVLSSPTSQFANATSTCGKLRRLVRSGVVFGALSGGIFPLADSGLLAGHNCSIHWVYEAAFKSKFPDISATDKVITIDRKCETASGSAAVFDLMLKHIEKRLSTEVMTEVACWFQHPFIRGENIAQRVPTGQTENTQDMLPPLVANAVKMFSENIEEPLRVTEVAKALNMSTRQLDRRFQSATGQSPLKYYQKMRLEKARQMVIYSDDALSEIALAVGYSSSTPFTRQYRDLFGQTPSEQRENANQFRVVSNS